jgi:hypothetical protein
MKFAVIYIFCILYITSNGQQAVVTSGGDASGSAGSISYSIGQVAYSTSAGAQINEGVQQPFELFITSVDASFAAFEINLFPNPTSHEFIIEMKNYVDGIAADVYDADGKLIESRRLLSERTSINVRSWSAATYLIRLTDTSGKSVSYRLIKH